jgi:hypothetical protein
VHDVRERRLLFTADRVVSPGGTTLRVRDEGLDHPAPAGA